MERAASVRATVWIALTAAGVSCALTLLWLAMRSVLDVGGYCAEGGPYEIHQHCPQGVPGITVGSIWGGLIFAGAYVVVAVKYKVPNLAVLLWPALFLSLGWNFFEFGFNPPGEGGGVAWGWLVCGVVFALMGGLPLLVVLPSLLREFRHGPQERPGWTRTGIPLAHAQRVAARVVPPPARPGLVGELERLAELRRKGALSETEFRRAKEKLIGSAS